MSQQATVSAAGLSHAAAFYRSAGEYLHQVQSFIEAGLGNGDPVFVAVPGPKVELLRDRLNGGHRSVTFADMRRMGANPAWIIPRVQAFLDANPGTRVRYVGEPIYETRSAEELTEATRHEALINLAFAGVPVSILCPYDSARLGARVLAHAEQTHPVLVGGGRTLPSPAYLGAGQFPESCDEPLPQPPADAATLVYGPDPARVRAFVQHHAGRAGLPANRAADLTIAASELAANTLRHTRRDGTVAVWATSAELICDVRDSGQISDPLVGRRKPPPDSAGGHGLWVVHQLCDLVELRTGRSGTAVRLHMWLAG